MPHGQATPTVAADLVSGTAAPARPSAVSLRGLTKRYGERSAVEGLTIDVPAGVVAGFVGPNGAGKTTTMAMLLGLVAATEGTGTVLGEPLGDPASYLGRVGALIEGPAFYPGLTGAQNLAVLAAAAGHDPAEIPGLLELVGLEARADDRFRRYSFGMKQRLGIAGALLGDPRLLILDEPINGLDPAGVHEMRGLIGQLAGAERTVLVSSHVLSELEQVCDWLIVIDGGRLVFQGPADELLDGSGASLVVAPEHPDDLERLRGMLATAGHDSLPGDDDLQIAVNGADPRGLAAAVNRAAGDGGVVLAELRVARTSLEDRYLTLVNEGGER
jgi:ABC-2 type transport system ATP-binding protein